MGSGNRILSLRRRSLLGAGAGLSVPGRLAGRAAAATPERGGHPVPAIDLPAARTNALRSGQAHFVDDPDPKTAPLLARVPGVGLADVPSAGHRAFAMRCDTPPFDDVRLAGGRILPEGEDILGATHERLREIRGRRVTCVTPGAAAFHPAHRIEDRRIEVAVEHGVTGEAEARAGARRLFARLRLPDPGNFGRRYRHRVSGGQLQRAMTVMALVPRPDLVVFDEPTTDLDVTTRIEVLAASGTATEDGQLAAIHMTHHLASVKAVADDIVVLLQGRVVESGPESEVLRPPHHPCTGLLLSPVPEMEIGWLDRLLREREERRARGAVVWDTVESLVRS